MRFFFVEVRRRAKPGANRSLLMLENLLFFFGIAFIAFATWLCFLTIQTNVLTKEIIERLDAIELELHDDNCN